MAKQQPPNLLDTGSSPVAPATKYHELFTCGCILISDKKNPECPDHTWGIIKERTIWGL